MKQDALPSPLVTRIKQDSVPRLFFPASMDSAKLSFSCLEFHKRPSTSFLEDLFHIGEGHDWPGNAVERQPRPGSLHWTLRMASDVLLACWTKEMMDKLHRKGLDNGNHWHW